MEQQLRRLQLTQLEILKVIDKVCREHDIPYSLYAGTLLGAVRHQGFIPWDDDLDICMSRANYNRFLKIWEQVQPEGYLLQNKENAPEFPQSFSKIRKLDTTFQMKSGIGKTYFQGIFVDVFPIDRCPEGKFQKKLFLFDCMRYQLYTREFVPAKSSSAVKLVSRLLLLAVPASRRMAVREKLLNRITRYSDDPKLPAMAIETMHTLGRLYPADMLDKYVDLPFEDGMFMCFADWDENLKHKFGDYMQLPPEEERTWRHPPVKIDFECYSPLQQ